MSSAGVSHVILRVSSLDRAVAFWSGILGFPVLSRSDEFAFLDTGSCKVALNEVDGGDAAARDSITEVVLEAADPRGAHASWHAAGVPFQVGLRPVTEQGGRALLAAHFRDPDGHLVSLTGWE